MPADPRELLVPITSDRGLCGGFNTNICRKAKSYFEKILKEDKTLKIFTVGSKGYEQLKRNYGKLATGTAATIYNSPEILELLRFFYKDGGIAGLPPMRGMVTGPGKYSQQLEFDFTKDIERRIKKNPAKAVKPGTYAVPAIKAGVRKYLPSLEGIGGRVSGGIKNLFRKIEMPPKRISTGMPPGTNLSSAQIAAGMGTRPLTFLERVNMFRKANPRTFYSGLGLGTTSGAIPYIGGKLAEGTGNLGLQIADLAVSDKFLKLYQKY